MKTVTEVEICGQTVEIKSKPDPRHVSGWSVIAFTPVCSLRTVRSHNPVMLDKFCAAVVSAVDDGLNVDEFEDAITQVREAVESIVM